MTKEQLLFLKSISQKVNNDVSDVDVKAVLKLASKHSVVPLCYENLCHADGFCREKFTNLQTKIYSIVFSQAKRTASYKKIYQSLLDNGIKPIVLKGIIYLQLYGDLCDHRPSGDEDVLVKSEDFFKVRDILIMYRLSFEKRRNKRNFLIVSFVLNVMAVMLSLSCRGILVFVASQILILCRNGVKKTIFRMIKYGVIIIVVLALISVLIPSLRSPIRNITGSVVGIFNDDIEFGIEGDNSLEVQYLVWLYQQGVMGVAINVFFIFILLYNVFAKRKRTCAFENKLWFNWVMLSILLPYYIALFGVNMLSEMPMYLVFISMIIAYNANLKEKNHILLGGGRA